jgi:ATP-binding cassette subfamily B (MDR/TAP) protein 1
MFFAAAIEVRKFLGEDESHLDSTDGLDSPSGIVIETLLDIRTVSALTLEKQRYEDYERALLKWEPNYSTAAFVSGFVNGLSAFVQHWITALKIWWGGYLIFHNPSVYSFRDFLIADAGVFFGFFGLGVAIQEMSDTSEVRISALSFLLSVSVVYYYELRIDCPFCFCLSGRGKRFKNLFPVGSYFCD